MPRLSKIGAAAIGAFGFAQGGGGIPVTAAYLLVAGGGGGGWGSSGGGGGAGGLLTSSAILNAAQNYTVTIGAGGDGSTPSVTNGANTTITGLGFTRDYNTDGLISALFIVIFKINFVLVARVIYEILYKFLDDSNDDILNKDRKSTRLNSSHT